MGLNESELENPFRLKLAEIHRAPIKINWCFLMAKMQRLQQTVKKTSEQITDDIARRKIQIDSSLKIDFTIAEAGVLFELYDYYDNDSEIIRLRAELERIDSFYNFLGSIIKGTSQRLPNEKDLKVIELRELLCSFDGDFKSVMDELVKYCTEEGT